MNRALGTLLATMAAFSTGIVAGLLIAPKSGKENRQWITEHSGEARSWMEKQGHKLIEESEKRIGQISKGVKDAIPDLYEATESIEFEDEDLENA